MSADASQAEAWDGADGRHWVEQHDRYDRRQQEITARLLAAADTRSGDAVLDIGCGCGSNTVSVARRAAPGHTLGVDLSGPMLAEARSRADRDGATNVRFERADVQTATFDGGLDVALSRFGIMFFDVPDAALATSPPRCARVGAWCSPAGRIRRAART